VKPAPIKWRISLLIAVVLSGVILAVIAEAYAEVKALLLRETDRSLTASAQAAAVVVDEDDVATTQAAEIRAIVGASLPKKPAFCRVWAAGAAGNLYVEGLAGNEAALEQELKRVTPPAPGASVFFDMGPSQDPYRAIWSTVQTRRGPVHFVIGQSTRRMWDELHELLRTFLIVGGAVVLVSAILVMLVVVWGLRPIDRTAAKLSQVTAHNVGSVTLSGEKTPAEILPFVHSVRTMLDRLNQALEQQKAFISDASHELRTPVALAKSTVQLALSKDRPAEEYRAALASSLEDLRRMEHLTEELLDLARMENAPELPAPTDVDLAALLRDLAEVYSPLAAEGGGRIACDLQRVIVRGEELQLRRLFGNLIDNAIRHGPRGGKVTLSLKPDGPGWVAAVVRDEGGNVPADVLPRLFDRFFRADASRSHATGGTGLGLAIARQIALRHGGEIVLRSFPAEGTSATVRLPAP
jgi:heavy metal sensor kinase